MARLCGVSRSAVSLWARNLAQGGTKALRAGRLGRPGGLAERQRAELVRLLKQGVLAAGYGTELWALGRVRRLIRERFGQRYSQTQVWRILREQLGWSC